MKRTLTTLFLAMAIAVCPLGPTARAQQQVDQTAKVKAEVVNRLNKKEEHVKVRLRNGTEVRGYIIQTSDNGFTLSNEKTKTGTEIAYADVQHIEGRGMSKTKKIAIAAGIGAAIFAAAFIVNEVALFITHPIHEIPTAPLRISLNSGSAYQKEECDG